MPLTDFYHFKARLLPLIEEAAEAAKRRASLGQIDNFILWEIYRQERDRLFLALTEFELSPTVRPDRFSEELTPEEFEQYVLNRIESGKN